MKTVSWEHPSLRNIASFVFCELISRTHKATRPQIYIFFVCVESSKISHGKRPTYGGNVSETIPYGFNIKLINIRTNYDFARVCRISDVRSMCNS